MIIDLMKTLVQTSHSQVVEKVAILVPSRYVNRLVLAGLHHDHYQIQNSGDHCGVDQKETQ